VLLERPLVIKRSVAVIAVVAIVHWSVRQRVDVLLEKTVDR
jgi:hypothetical protein